MLARVMRVSNATAESNSGKKPSGTRSETPTDELLALPIEDLFVNLGTSQSGLTSEEVNTHFEIFGHNELAKRKRRTAVVDFFYHLKNPLILILLLAGLVSGFSGGREGIVNAVIIFFILLLSVFLEVYQENKAENAAELLKEKVTTTATVIRDGANKEVKLSDIVPGDVIYLSAGDMVPADARIVSAKDLYINQSVLTGESFPIEKTPQSAPTRTTDLTTWNNCLFLGTSVVSGTANAVVIKTGNSTEFGKIAKKLVDRVAETDFEKGLGRFGFLIMEVTVVLVLFVFLVISVVKPAIMNVSPNVLETLLFAVALAVGLTPELLPVIMSINLSKGALAMAKRGVIIKRLVSIQNFGSMDTLCTDKTGTLTENEITLVLHVDIEGIDNDKVLLYSFLNSHFQTGLKSPLDDAILAHKEINVENYQKIDEVPFDFTRKRVSIVVEHERQRFFIAKGAPEEIIRVSTYGEIRDVIVDFSLELQKMAEEKYYDLSAQGYRVLAVSYKKVKEEKSNYSVNDESDMVFLGFVAFLDPPKETAKESTQSLRNTGIQLKILTGDNELVTKKTCEQLGFQITGIVQGSEIAQLGDDALARVVEEANVFARVTPAQKDRIMNALKRNGHVVGFLGDGINDAPSLRTADVGVSVENAVDVAREAADIILLRKDLTVLQQGVQEGRRTFGNTMKYIMMGTSSNFGNMFSVAGASLFLPFLPMSATQILLNNLLYDASELTIPTDNIDEEYSLKPKRWDVSYIKQFMIYFGPISSIFDFLTFFIMLFVFQASTPLFQTAWFIESLCTQTLVIFVIRTRKTPFYRSIPSRLLLLSSLSVVAIALAIPLTPLGALFEFTAPPFMFYIILAGLIAAYLALVEIVKKRFYKRYLHLVEKM
jgi:Mg2+-importing ATPase